jgi:hypothetical protein
MAFKNLKATWQWLPARLIPALGRFAYTESRIELREANIQKRTLNGEIEGRGPTTHCSGARVSSPLIVKLDGCGVVCAPAEFGR